MSGRRRGGVRARRSASGWCNNKACGLWRPTLSDASSLPPPHLPALQVQVQGCQVKHEGRILSLPVIPPQNENTWSLQRGGWGLGWDDLATATPPAVLVSFSFPHIQALTLLFPPPPSLIVPHRSALSCQTEKWQTRQRSPAWGDGQGRTEASRHTRTHTNACTHT